MKQLTIITAQVNPLVGDVDGNARLVGEIASRYAQEQTPHILVFPELTLTGYPPEDLLLRPGVELRVEKAIQELCQSLPQQLYVLIGYPEVTPAGLCNVAGVLHQGRVLARYAKQLLPNYQVFDEKRYFVPGVDSCVVDIAGIQVALSVCEDVWQSGPSDDARDAGAMLMLNINASPFHIGKQAQRLEVIRQRVLECAMPIVYVNQVGGQDELVFDGGSFALDGEGELRFQAPVYEDHVGAVLAQYDPNSGQCRLQPSTIETAPSRLDAVYQALVLGVRDYVNKNHFKGVGLSGGINSALTLAVAVDALGADRVSAVMMPFRYTSDMSRDDAAEQAAAQGVDYSSIPIEAM